MGVSSDAGNIEELMKFIENKNAGESMRDAVIRYYISIGESSGITVTKDVGVIVNGVEIGTVDCVIANPASIAVAYAEDKLGALLGLWILAEFGPRIGILAMSSGGRSLISDVSSIIRRSHLLRYSAVRFFVIDIEGGRKEVIQRRGGPSERRKIIKGKRPAYKKQD